MAYMRQDSKMPQLKQTLQDYLTHGIQDFPGLVTFGVTQEVDQESLQIEDSWRKFADKTKVRDLTKKQREQQDAIWDIIKAEVNHIQDLRIMKDFYLRTLVNLQASIMLNEIETESIFSNMAAIEKLHSTFWNEKLSHVLKKARAKKKLPSAADLVEALEGRFESICAPYREFANSRSDCLKYLRGRMKDNEMFRYFIEWAQRHPRSRNRKLSNLLDAPLHLMTRYPLLLGTLLKTTEYQMQYLSNTVLEMKESSIHVLQQMRETLERTKKRRSFEGWWSPRGSKEYPSSPGGLFEESFDCVSVEEAKIIQLEETLNDIMKHGLQDFSGLLTFSTKREEDGGFPKIEVSWRAYVDRDRLSEMDEKAAEQQDTIWDLIATEVCFIRDIRIVVDFYLCALLNVQASVFLNDVETELIFGNITAIEKLHTSFWKEKLSAVASKPQVEKEPMSVSDVAEAFRGFAGRFAPYLEFCRSEHSRWRYLSDQLRQNNSFKFFIEWAEGQPNSRGLKFEYLLGCPMRHIAKYPLLLTEMENCLSENQTEVSSIVSEVKEFANRVREEYIQRYKEPGNEDRGGETHPTRHLRDQEMKASTSETRQDDTSCEYVDEISTCLVRQDPKLQELQQMLDDFLINGFQDFTSLLTFDAKEDEPECFQLENSWRDFADEQTTSGLDRRQTVQQEAMWELIAKESAFIQRLGIVEDVYLTPLLNLQASIMLNEIETERVFGSISAVRRLHTRFWKEKLSKVLEKARTEKRLPSVSDLSEAFRGFGSLFAPYLGYVEQSYECHRYRQQQQKANERFRYFLEWAEGNPKAHGWTLERLLQCPVQQFSRYPILLAAIEKRTLDDGTLSQRILEVKEFMQRVNQNLRLNQEERMKTHVKTAAPVDVHEADSSCEYVDEVITALIRQDSKMARLQEVLGDLAESGLQDFQGLLQFCPRQEDQEICLRVEDTWRECAGWGDVPKMSEREMEQQDAIWDIVKTEARFVRDLRVVDLYLRTLLNVQAAMLLSDIQTESVFGNISAIEELHGQFWARLHGIAAGVRAGQGIPSVADLAEAFEGFARLFAPYIRYSVARRECQKYLTEQRENNEMFRMILEWVERHPDSRGLKLPDLLDLPMQRIAMYPTLWAVVEGTLDEQDEAEVSEIVHQVAAFAARVSLVSKPAKETPREPSGAGSAKSHLVRQPAVRHQSASREEDKKRLMIDILDKFLADRIPDAPTVPSLSVKAEDGGGSLKAEASWQSLSDRDRLVEMSKKEADQQDAIWAVITTEVRFIEDLHLVLDLYRRSLTHLQASFILNEIDKEKLFRITDAILRLHSRFWSDRLSLVTRRAQQEERFLSAEDLLDAFGGFADHFATYMVLLKAQQQCIKYLREQITHSKLFRSYLAWAERQAPSRGRSLQDVLMCPMQHLTKYAPLLSTLEDAVHDQYKAEVSEKRVGVEAFVMLLQSRMEQLGATGQQEAAVGGQDTAGASLEYAEVFEPPASEESAMLRLTETLDDFQTYGLQDFPALLTFTAKRTDKDWFDIERSWVEFTDQETVSALGQSAVDQQDAIWDIISTEVNVICDLRIVVDVYLCSLLNLQGAILLNQIQTEKIFGNVAALEKRHTKFWTERLSHVVWRAREEQRLPSALDLAEAFKGFEALTKLHVRFCAAKNRCLRYLQEETENNKMFRYFIEWGERNPKSRGRRLGDLLELLGKRITAYPALLAAVVDKTLEDEHKEVLTARLSEVEQCLMQVPLEMRQESDMDAKATSRTLSMEDEKMLKLQQTLAEFMATGLESFPVLVPCRTDREEDEQCLWIEDSWQALAAEDNGDDLGAEETERQEAIWELLRSEVGRVKDCRAVVALYRCTLLNLQANGLLNEVQTERVFGNATAIEEVHARFWKEKLSGVLEKARVAKRLPSAADLADAFQGFAKLFAPYVKFCTASSVGLVYLRQQINQSPMFRFYLDWAERHPDSHGLPLEDFLAYPTQHLSRYHRLLQKVDKKMSTEEGTTELGNRISEVHDFIGTLSRITKSQNQPMT